MKKTIKIISKLLILVFVFSLVITSCNNFDEDINIDPNNVSTVPTAYLLSSAQKDLVTRFLDIYNGDFDDFGTSYSQHIAGKTYTDTERVETEQSGFNNTYAGGFMNLKNIIDLNTNEETKAAAEVSGPNDNQIAVAKVLLSWGFMNITDLWGSAPYSEALLARENFSPKYDSQKEIYAGLILELNTAIGMMVDGSIDGDIIYNGDMNKWKKFAASLLMRAGMRISNADAAMGKDAFLSGLNTGSLNSNTDNALYSYVGGEQNSNGYWVSFINQNRFDHAVSHTMVQMLGDNNDPRLPIYATPVVSEATVAVGPSDFWAKYKIYTVNGEKYAGQPWGYQNGTATTLTTEQVSFVGTYFQEDKTPAVLMTYAEVQFLMAEAIEKGWVTTGIAKDFYKNGIKASMEFYNIGASSISNYIDNEPFAQYDSGNYMKSIGQQKWIAMYLQGLNTWAEWRRTGFPVLSNAPDASEGRAIPRRRAYSQTEFDLNLANVEAAVSTMGTNDTTTKVWWDGGN